MLIFPDLNTGNNTYKAVQQVFRAQGLRLQDAGLQICLPSPYWRRIPPTELNLPHHCSWSTSTLGVALWVRSLMG